MDALLFAAARALATGDPLGALQGVALRDDAAALALHGIALAQLGELARARELLQRAAAALGRHETVARARCVVAYAEIALAMRELGAEDGDRTLETAAATLEAHGDRANALHARLIAIRRWLLLGRIDRAERAASAIELRGAPAMVVAIGELVTAEIAVRRIRTEAARAAFDRAGAAASRAGIAALAAEIAVAREALAAPAARAIAAGEVRLVRLDEVEAILGSADLVVDGCRRIVRDARSSAGFASRPVLFAVVRALAEAWPGEVTREALVASAFAVRRVSDSQRARLRVEISRLRRELRAIAEIQATRLGFVLTPRQARRVIVLVPPIDGPGAAVRALLADGEAWSTSALAVALGQSQRTVQRALSELEARAQVQSRGGARARRWLTAPVTAVSTTLLLPALPIADDRDPDRD